MGVSEEVMSAAEVSSILCVFFYVQYRDREGRKRRDRGRGKMCLSFVERREEREREGHTAGAGPPSLLLLLEDLQCEVPYSAWPPLCVSVPPYFQCPLPLTPHRLPREALMV